jgi:serine/threonine protein kinase
MISYEGSAKLLDFGVAKERNDGEATTSGTVKGKFAYMSPEQCSAGPVDGRSDLFSLGICLYEALTGRPLYRREAQFETFRAITGAPVPSIRDADPTLPEAIDDVVQRALQKHPDHRFQTGAEMQAALEQYLMDHREVVLAPRIAEFLGSIFADEIANGPDLDRSAESEARIEGLNAKQTVSLQSSSVLTPGMGAAAERARDRPRWLWTAVAVAVVLVVGIAIGFGFALGARDDTPPTATPTGAPTPREIAPSEPEPTTTSVAEAIDEEASQRPDPDESASETEPEVTAPDDGARTTIMRRRGTGGRMSEMVRRGFVDDPGF